MSAHKSITAEDLKLIAYLAERAEYHARNAVGGAAAADCSGASRSAADAAVNAAEAARIAFRLAALAAAK